MTEVVLKQWGNSQGIRIPKDILRKIGIEANNAKFNIEVNNNSLILKKKNESKLAQRFEGFDTEKYWTEWDKQHPGQSKEIDWGQPVGKEIKW